MAIRAIRQSRGTQAGNRQDRQAARGVDQGTPEVLEALVTQAKAGDTSAIKLVLERTVPALRPVDAVATLNLPVDGGLADQGRAVLAALASGYLPVNQAAGILQGLGNLAKRVELDELEKRVAALEGKRG